MSKTIEKAGAGEGNRTLVFSLEGCCSTIELHPRQGDQLTRRDTSLNRPEAGRPPKGTDSSSAPLNTGRFRAYTEVSINKERR